MNYVRSKSRSLKYQRFTPSYCTDIGVRKFELVAKTQILSFKFEVLEFLIFRKNNLSKIIIMPLGFRFLLYLPGFWVLYFSPGCLLSSFHLYTVIYQQAIEMLPFIYMQFLYCFFFTYNQISLLMMILLKYRGLTLYVKNL